MKNSTILGRVITIDSLIRGYETQLGIPDHFIVRLLREPDDWSFVIKLHGLLEGGLARKLLELFEKPGLEKPFRKIQMRTLIGLADGLGALTKRSITFLEALSELRNKLVHDVANVTFRLQAWATEADNKPTRLFGPQAEQEIAAATQFDPYRFALWAEMLVVLAQLQNATDVQVTNFQAMIDAEVKKRAELENDAVRDALLKLLASGEEPGASK